MPAPVPTAPSAPPGGEDAARQRWQRQIRALRLSVNVFAVMAGLACYLLLETFHLTTGLPALLIGLVFTLLTRTAMMSLVGEWLLQRVRRSRGASSSGTPTGQ